MNPYAAALTAALSFLPVGLAAQAQTSPKGVNVGSLTCTVAGGVGFVFGSSKDLDCILARANGTAEHYTGTIKVLGREGLGIVYIGANTMQSGNYISEHDTLISQKLGHVLSGGDLSEPTEVSEQYLLDLERKTFLELCMQRKTLERLQSIITSGKVLRN